MVSIVCDLARSTCPLLLRSRGGRGGRAGFSGGLDMIGVFVGLRLGILGRTTAFTLGWGIDALILRLSLGGPASLPLGCLLAGRLCGRSAGLLVLRALGAASTTLGGSFCGTSGVGGRVNRCAWPVSIVCGIVRGGTRHR